jgi:Ca2+-transporting ATPase
LAQWQLREEWEPKVKEVYGFSSAKKMASVLVELPDSLRLYNKGAAEWVLKRCTRMVVPGGGVSPMTDADREHLVQVRDAGNNPRDARAGYAGAVGGCV